MPTAELVALAALRGAAEALGTSASGAEIAARVAVDPPLGRPGAPAEAAIAFGAALAIGLSLRRRLGAMLAEGVRAVARPELVRDVASSRDAPRYAVALGASAALHLVTRGVYAPWQASPLAAGAGLLATGIALASLAVAARGAPRTPGRRAPPDSPSVAAAIVAGAAHGAAGYPGASRVAAALVVLVWWGVRPARAAEFALALTCASLLATAAASALGGGERIVFVPVLAAFVAAFTAALLGAATLRALALRRRVPLLAVLVAPLGVALLAYARALPGG